MENSRAVGTPGAKDDNLHDEVNEQELLNKEDSRIYRRAAARLNYLSLDRPDIGYAIKEVARCMANPRVGDDSGIKRIIRYLVQYPVLELRYPFQDRPVNLKVQTDSDWAGCT